MRYLLPLFLFCLFQAEALHYPFTCDPIDVIIPCHEKDTPILEMCLAGIRENGENIGNIYVISKERLTDQAEWIEETIFPFTKLSIASKVLGSEKLAKAYLKLNTNKAGWVYQQLLKFYAPLLLPKCSSNVLILDADTVFLNPVSFLTNEGCPLFTPCENKCDLYFAHMKKFLPEVNPDKTITAVSNHMLFQRAVLEDLFSEVETAHQKPFWEAFCLCSHFTCLPSEYEIYYHFLSSRSDQPQLRRLKWANLSNPSQIPAYRETGHHFVSLHSYMRR